MSGVHQQRSQSPRLENGRLERKPSIHAHHRQTSIVNGVQHRSGLHSRSGSWVNSPATSPLSPPLVMQATITARDMVHIPQIPLSPMAPMMSTGMAGSAGGQIQMPQFSSATTSAPPNMNGGNAIGVGSGGGGLPGSVPNQQVMAERPPMITHQSSPGVMQFQKPPRTRAHHHSHSHHHNSHHRSRDEETKTPAEYALHILFTQVGDGPFITMKKMTCANVKVVCSCCGAKN